MWWTRRRAPAGRGGRSLQRLAELPWVCRASSEAFENTGSRWRVKPGGTEKVEEILVTCGDGQKGQRIRLTTTCRTPQERQWCLEELKGVF